MLLDYRFTRSDYNRPLAWRRFISATQACYLRQAPMTVISVFTISDSLAMRSLMDSASHLSSARYARADASLLFTTGISASTWYWPFSSEKRSNRQSSLGGMIRLTFALILCGRVIRCDCRISLQDRVISSWRNSLLASNAVKLWRSRPCHHFAHNRRQGTYCGHHAISWSR